jgi:RNase P/RNase MRP subunit p30
MEYFGQQAIEVHYQSRNQQQLIDFIENVVLKDKTKREMRAEFVNNTLLNKNKVTASQIMQF